MEEEKTIKFKFPNSNFWIVGEKRTSDLWDVYLWDPETDKKDLVKSKVTKNNFMIFVDRELKPLQVANDSIHNDLINKPFTLGNKITWIVLIFLVFWGIYNIGKNSNKQLTPTEIEEEMAYCYKWYGKACDDPNFNPD